MLVFRSILVPLKATLGFLLSIGATFGVLVAIFQWGGWFAGILGIEGQTGSVVAMLPIFMIGIVFGLAMDYQVFLVTRMREAFVHGDGPDEAVVKGFDQGARVVTAAALIMIAVFAGFIFGGDASSCRLDSDSRSRFCSTLRDSYDRRTGRHVPVGLEGMVVPLMAGPVGPERRCRGGGAVDCAARRFEGFH